MQFNRKILAIVAVSSAGSGFPFFDQLYGGAVPVWGNVQRAESPGRPLVASLPLESLPSWGIGVESAEVASSRIWVLR